MKRGWAWAAVAAVLAAGVAVYYWRAAAPADPAPVAAVPPAPAAPPATTGPPPIAYPVPAAPPGAPPLPALDQSDGVAREAAVALFGRDAFARIFRPDALVRHFVVTVDNLPRRTAAVRLLPVQPVPGAFVVQGRDGDATIAADNALRYRPYVAVLEAADARRLVAAYVTLYPLFQAAYVELGYPDGWFNDRLVQAIDDLLAAPEVAAPRVVQPKVLWAFADAGLEARSAGQKIMLRMGPANAARVKAQLRAIRAELAAASAPR